MPRRKTEPVPAFKKSWEHYNGTELRPITETVLSCISDGEPIPSDVIQQYNHDLRVAEIERLEEVQQQAKEELARLRASE